MRADWGEWPIVRFPVSVQQGSQSSCVCNLDAMRRRVGAGMLRHRAVPAGVSHRERLEPALWESCEPKEPCPSLELLWMEVAAQTGCSDP